MNVFDRAMQMESDGKAFYEKLAEDVQSEGLKTIFRWLAVDEQKHFDTFQAMKKQAKNLVMADSKALEGAKDVFAELQRKKEVPAGGAKNLEAYQFALKVEAESAKFYREAAGKETNQEAKDLLLRIAVEEQKHYNIIENIFEFVNAPTNSLVWGEFSNLDEF